MVVGFGGGFLHKNVYICILLQARVISQYNGKTLVNTINTTNGDVAQLARALDWQTGKIKIFNLSYPFNSKVFQGF